MKNIKKYLIVPSILWSANFLYAQKPVEAQQEIIKNFDARLIDAEKVSTTPLLPAIDTTTRPQTYNVQPRSVGVAYLAPKLRPIALKPDPPSAMYNGYVKAGYGSPNSPYVQAGYQFSQPKLYNVGLKINHHSADYKNIENQRFSMTGASLNGAFFAPNGMGIEADLGYNANAQWLYGYDHVRRTFSKEAARQHFNGLDLGARLYNSQRTMADFDYGVGVRFYTLADNFSASETNFDIKAEGTKWFSEKHPLNLTIRANFNALDTNGSVNQSLNTIFIKPNFTFHGDIFKVRVGMNLVSYKDEFYPMPDLEATVNAIGNQLVAYAGWKGDFVINSLRNISNYNPYIVTQRKLGGNSLRIENTQQTEFYGGLKGALSFLDYQAQIGYQQNNNLALFLADTAEEFRRFTTLYDSVSIFNIRGTVTMRLIKRLELTGTISQNIYTTQTQERAWGLPSLDVNVGAKYTLITDKAFARGNLFVQNGVNYRNAQGQADRLGALFDLSLGAEYWASKNFGFFFDVNNLLNNKRQRWFNYPIYGLNIMGGLSARF
jgi:hypothetical protein